MSEKETEINPQKQKKSLIWLLAAMSALIWLIASVLLWERSRWSKLNFNELLNQLLTPIEGTGSVIMNEFIGYSLIPAVIIFVCLVLFLKGKQKRKALHLKASRISALASVIALIVVCALGLNSLDFFQYVINKHRNSEFIETNYISPNDVSVSFPEKKRNLIYIWLESMETAYTDQENGGFFAYNAIPNLTKWALGNECFNGGSGQLEGAYALNGTTWTAGALFGSISGIPLDIPIAGSSMQERSSFFPGAISIGDILKAEGYNQTLLIGSDASFGGRRNMFQTHGGYEIRDYEYSRSVGEIDPDYRVWWGYEDEKLFTFAKSCLQELAAKDEPFNLTMLTADTHFPSGYWCEDCKEIFDEQYANVIHCSDKKLNSFLEWLSEQDFYNNTTIVLCGDHPTMDNHYCTLISNDYGRRVYVSIINPACENEQPGADRLYSTFDMYPTTLAALGARIEGDRLGLGTNLFSAHMTLLEEYGLDYVQTQLSQSSSFLQSLSGIDEAVYEKSKAYYAIDTELEINVMGNNVGFVFSNLEDIEDECDSFTAYCDVMHGETRSTIAFKTAEKREDGKYEARFDFREFRGEEAFMLNVFADTEDGRIQVSAGVEIDVLELQQGK